MVLTKFYQKNKQMLLITIIITVNINLKLNYSQLPQDLEAIKFSLYLR